MKTFLKNSTLAVCAAFLLWSNAVVAQNEDTTKIKLGDKRITIIKHDADKASQDLENTMRDFEDKMKVLQDSMQQMNSRMGNTNTDDVQRQGLQKQIDDLNRRIDAYNKGIGEMQRELEDMKKGGHDSHDIHIGDARHDDDDADDADDDSDDADDCDDDDCTRHDHKKSRHFDGHWAGFEFGLNNFVNSQYQMTLPEDGQFMELNTNRSWAFSLNLFEYGFAIVPHNLGVVTGAGIDWNNYHFEKNISLQQDGNGRITGVAATQAFDKNKLQTTYLNIPLLLEWRLPIGDKRKFFINAGVEGGIKLDAYTLQRYHDNERGYKDVKRGDYQLSPFRYGFTARVGYGNVRAFATYTATPLFESNKGPLVQPITIGVTFIDF